MGNLWLISAMLVLIDVPITSQLYADFSADSFVSWNQRIAKKRKKFFNLLTVEALHSNEMVKQSKNKLFGGVQASVSLKKYLHSASFLHCRYFKKIIGPKL